MNRTFEEGELDREDVRVLLGKHFTEMTSGTPASACHVMTAETLHDPVIRFFTIRDEAGALLGCGALKRLADHHGELKSMRTEDAALGQGVGSAMLNHLIRTARASGMTRLSLETGNSEMFAAANRLYRREGFTGCGAFAGYRPTDFTTFYTRTI